MGGDNDNLTSFQRKRLENIKRNNELLQKLNLNKIIDLPKDDKNKVKKKKKSQDGGVRKRTTRSTSVKLEQENLPVRRSRRLQGQKAEEVKDNEYLNENLEPNNISKRVKKEPGSVEPVVMVGDIKLSDLVKDEETLRNLDSLKVSSGDFFNELRKLQSNNDEIRDDIQQEYDNFSEMTMVQSKVIYERISSLFYHPGTDQDLIIAGDVSGSVGLWKADLTQDEFIQDENVTRFNMFSKNVSKIDCMPSRMENLIIASYDGKIRSMDLNKLQSFEIVRLTDEYNDYLGISDCQFSYQDPNLLYLTTLGGEFTMIDLREDNSKLTDQTLQIRRLSDKKIGSMSINPHDSNQIATGSLDRTLKIWDIRSIVIDPEWSQFDDYSSHKIVSTYDSRLSVSAVSYSPIDKSLVCNGYDDTIRLFDVSKEQLEASDSLEPKLTIKHNCQTGRWTSILKARFKNDRDIFAIGNMSRAIDIYTSKGKQIAHLKTPTVPAVVSWSPLHNRIAGGNSSGKVFLFSKQDNADEKDS